MVQYTNTGEAHESVVVIIIVSWFDLYILCYMEGTGMVNIEVWNWIIVLAVAVPIASSRIQA